MVHALEKIHWLLKPDGRLIDIHPSGQPPPIMVRVGAERFLAGWLKEEDDYIEYAQADGALGQVVRQGLFVLERRETFAFTTCADTLSDLRHYLAKTWQKAIIEDNVARRIDELMSNIERDKEIIVREVIKIARLRPLYDKG